MNSVTHSDQLLSDVQQRGARRVSVQLSMLSDAGFVVPPGAKILDLLFDLNQAAGTTLVLVTHDLEAAGRCQHVIEMAGGRVVNQAA